MTQLVWLRNDLRVEDNPALAAACAGEQPVVAVYLVPVQTWQRHGMAPRKADLIRRRLHHLCSELRQREVALRVIASDWFSDAAALLLQLMHELGAAEVHANGELLLDENRRDLKVMRRLEGEGMRLVSHADGTLVRPGSVLTGAGDIYKVYTPFRRALLRKLLTDGVPAVTPSPKRRAANPHASSTIAEIDAAFAAVPQLPSQPWAASRSEIWQQLQQFADGPLHQYHLQRDLPAVAGTSQLSAAFTLGMLGINETLDALLMRQPELLELAEGGAASWLNELCWREFYRHLCALLPFLVMEKPFKPETARLPWRQADDDFADWCEGRTGFPIIDAAMIQLRDTGWMHNRLRMVVASFLTKHLLIDWRRGADFFMRHLVDGDFAANNGGWQWAASTGCDAAPYFRIFNPISQSERFDADGQFLRRQLPQLAALSNKAIHDPHGRAPLVAQRLGYPQPIVDLRLGRERALAAFSSLQEVGV